MFTLSGLILETRQNLFRDFWSPFSISFYFSSERNLKKTRTDYGAYSTWTPPAGGLYIAPHRSPQPTPAPRLIRRHRGRRSSAPPEVRRRLDFRAEKKLKKKIFFAGFIFDFFYFFILIFFILLFSD